VSSIHARSSAGLLGIFAALLLASLLPTTAPARDLRGSGGPDDGDRVQQPFLSSAHQDPSAFPGASARAVRAQAAQCTVPQRLGVTFVIDDSGSMDSNDPDVLRANAVDLGLRELGPSGYASALRFSDTPSALFGATDLGAAPAPTADSIKAQLQSLGGTDYIEAFTAAKDQLATFPATVDQKIVVLLSDGQPTDGFDTQVDAQLKSLGVRVFPIGFGDADNGLLAEIAAKSGGISQSVVSGEQTQGAIGRAIAAARCQQVDLPETFDLAPGQTRKVSFSTPANLPSFSALATWAKGQIDVTLQRPDGSAFAPGQLRQGETLDPGATSARATATAPPAGRWTVILTAKAENAKQVSVSIDLIGGGTQDHQLEKQPDPLHAGCTTEAVIQGRVAWSRCFEPIPGGVHSTVPIRIAGIDVAPLDGHDVKLLTSGLMKSEKAQVSLFTHNALVTGAVPLWTGGLSVPLGQSFHFEGGKEISDGDPNVAIASLPIQRAPGWQLEWTTTGAKVTLSLDIGKQFKILLPPKDVDKKTPYGHSLKQGYGLEAVLTTTNEKGISVDSISGRIDEAKVFDKLTLKNLFLEYNAGDKILTGGGAVELFKGPLSRYAVPSIQASLGMQLSPLDFASFEAEVSDLNKPIGPYVFLQKIGGSITKNPPPFSVSGTTELTLGPKIDLPLLGSQSAVALTGSAKWSYPATVEGDTEIKILGQSAATGHIDANILGPEASLNTRVTLSFAGTGLTGELDGWLKSSQFQIGGNAQMTVFGKNVNGAEAVVGSTGAGACRRGWGPDYGWRADFHDKSIKVMATSCDFGDLRQLAKPSQVGGAAATQVGKGSRGELLQVVGTGGQPLGTVRGPDGTVVDIGTDKGAIENEKLAAIPDESTNSVWVVLNAPAAGTWTVEPRAGSAPLAIAGRANAKPHASVTGKLRRTGGGYRLAYKAKRSSGEKVVIVERGPGGRVHQLVNSRRTRGAVRFPKLEGPAGVRTIEATVRGADGVRLRTVIATYTAKKPVTPGAPRKLRVRRSGGTARISWAAPRGEKPARYVVTVRTKDGRRIETSVARTKAVLTGLAKKTAGKVTVRVVGQSGLESRAASGTLKRRR
jgi:hypothetical protein